ncbi:pheromone A receptor-domain-containing protein [Hygrophoropsis aurantiaca]|uniref:Pheromone A receptor-domain-containing protein n=1 Tax=Hygrophoropsis aurantiaca TaxID=72124 RepID=A0ACB8A2G9_9AGAM|nr:pheromone A receptor-domain-containing protein [Hygrophoropsis aurantiaca]
MVPSNTVFSVFAFLGFILVTIPLPWHLQSWNTGTCLYILWTSFGCLTQFINSVVWRDNVINWAPAWCDISEFIRNTSLKNVP